MKKKYYIYRYFNKNKEVIYVGLTSRPLEKRVKEHEIEALAQETAYIDFCEVDNRAQMEIYEVYYINKYRPRFNIKSLDKSEMNFELPELEFKPFKSKTEVTKQIVLSNSDTREYSLKYNNGLIEAYVLNPYARVEADRKVEINIKGNLILNRNELKDVIEMLIQATNDLTDDSYFELIEKTA